MKKWLLLLILITTALVFSQSISADQSCPDMIIVCKSDACAIKNDNSEESLVLPNHLKIDDVRGVVKGKVVLIETSIVYTSLLPVKKESSKTYLNCKAGSLQIEEFTSKDVLSFAGNLFLVILLVFALAFGLSSTFPALSIVVFVGGMITYISNTEPIAVILVCLFSVFCYWAFTREKGRNFDSSLDLKSGIVRAITILIIGTITSEFVAKFNQGNENQLIFQFIGICAATLAIELIGNMFRKYKLEKLAA